MSKDRIKELIISGQTNKQIINLLAYDYSCLMVDLPEQIKSSLKEFTQGKIKNEQLYIPDENPEEFGFPSNYHITVKYGLVEKDGDKFQDYIKPIKATLGPIDKFVQDDYDVIKVDVESDDLHGMHKSISDDFENHDEHPDYKPHITLAYVKPGEADDLMGQQIFEGDENEFELSDYLFSTPDDEKMELAASLIEASLRDYLLDNDIDKIWCYRYNKGKEIHGEQLEVDKTNLKKTYDELLNLTTVNQLFFFNKKPTITEEELLQKFDITDYSLNPADGMVTGVVVDGKNRMKHDVMGDENYYKVKYEEEDYFILEDKKLMGKFGWLGDGDKYVDTGGGKFDLIYDPGQQTKMESKSDRAGKYPFANSFSYPKNSQCGERLPYPLKKIGGLDMLDKLKEKIKVIRKEKNLITAATKKTKDEEFKEIFIKAEEENNFERWARKELTLAGLFKKDSDYEGMIGEGIMEIIKVWSTQRHSGGSAWVMKAALDKLLNWQNLTPLTANPDEWNSVTEYTPETPMWQSKRNPSCFSDDGLKSYYNLDDEPKKYYKFDAEEVDTDVKSKVLSMIDKGITDEEIIETITKGGN